MIRRDDSFECFSRKNGAIEESIRIDKFGCSDFITINLENENELINGVKKKEKSIKYSVSYYIDLTNLILGNRPYDSEIVTRVRELAKVIMMTDNVAKYFKVYGKQTYLASEYSLKLLKGRSFVEKTSSRQNG